MWNILLRAVVFGVGLEVGRELYRYVKGSARRMSARHRGPAPVVVETPAPSPSEEPPDPPDEPETEAPE